MSARYALFGHGIAHSLSPALHRAGFRALGVDATYELVDVPVTELADVLADLVVTGGLAGGNVTSPHKTFVYDACLTAMSTEAAQSASVNTLRIEGKSIVGHNTDGGGFVRFLERTDAGAKDRAFAILGGGGAASGLSAALRRAGAGEIVQVTRDPERFVRGDWNDLGREPRVLPWGSSEARRAIESADVVVNATPLGMRSGDPLPCPVEWVGPEALAVDLLYHPPESPWLHALRARGVRAANGIGLLVEQALLAQAFWFGNEPPRSALEEALPWSDPFSPPPADSRGSEDSPRP
jgi:shikimate dehydrogenase